MEKIVLRMGNVVKEVDSEEKAKDLEEKGFCRDGKKPKSISKETMADLEKENALLQERLQEAEEYAKNADEKIAGLERELEGTREQLKAAVETNAKEGSKKKKE